MRGGRRREGGVGDVLPVAYVKNFEFLLSVLMYFVTFTELEKCSEFCSLYRH